MIRSGWFGNVALGSIDLSTAANIAAGQRPALGNPARKYYCPWLWGCDGSWLPEAGLYFENIGWPA